MVDINLADVVTLGSLPDKVGLFGRRKDAAATRILQGRDSRSVRFLVPDVSGVDQNFHDVIIVDMDEEREPKVTAGDLTHLRDSWPPVIFNHMKWFQQALELLRKEAKREFTQAQPIPCKYCGKVISCNMYRHVARLHLDLAQLWRCPVSWCTVWRGSPQDCMEHLRNGHDVPWISKTASIERFAPPWTVRREVWTESIRLEHSGISTDILLFSELRLSLKHHYRVYRGGLPHAAFRSDYMARLRALLPTPRSTTGEPASPPETGRGVTPRSARRSHRLSRPVRVMLEAIGELPLLTVQNPADMVGATVIDCRPPGLPVSIPLSALSPGTLENARGTSGFNPSREGQSIMDMDTNEITIDRIVGFPWNDSGTDVEDELPTPASSPAQCTTPVVMTVEPGDPQELGDKFDLDLAKVLLDVSVMPKMISPIEDSMVSPTTEVADYAAPEIPTVEIVTESPGYAVPEDSEIMTSWVPKYSPASMTSTVGWEARPTSTGPDVSKEGLYDVYDVPPESGQSPLILNSLPGCQYRMTSYDDRDSRVDLDPAYGIHLHDPHMMEYMGAPESARLLGRTPEYWLEHMGRERTVAAARRLHHDASLIMTNVQVMAQFVTGLNRTASEVMRVVYDKEPFPTDEIQYVTPVRRVRRAAHYMAAKGLWPSGPVFPGPVPVSSCNSCMSCEDCFPDVPV